MTAGLLGGKRGVVFGVANERSIAWGCAQACAAAGAHLAFNYLGDAQEKRVKALLAENLPGALCFPCDVQNDAEIDTFFNEIRTTWGHIDFIIHSVAYADREDLKGRFVDTPRDHFRLALDISAYSLTALARSAEDLFGDTGGSIVAMTYYGAEKVLPKYNVMGVAKAALEASARYLANDLGPLGIRVNCISAGPVRTLSSAAFPGFRKMLAVSEEMAPLRKNITPEDVGNATLYLVSDLSSSVTGEVLHVDSGYNILGMFGSDEA
jgi:enoyl-[acyl-carrier protein] reductase I